MNNENKKKKYINISIIIAIIFGTFMILYVIFEINLINSSPNDENKKQNVELEVKLKNTSTENLLILTHKGGSSLKITEYNIRIIDTSSRSNQIVITEAVGILEFGNSIIFTNITNQSGKQYLFSLNEIELKVGQLYEVNLDDFSDGRNFYYKVICES